jgi:hypothetical protein
MEKAAAEIDGRRNFYANLPLDLAFWGICYLIF